MNVTNPAAKTGIQKARDAAAAVIARDISMVIQRGMKDVLVPLAAAVTSGNSQIDCRRFTVRSTRCYGHTCKTSEPVVIWQLAWASRRFFAPVRFLHQIVSRPCMYIAIYFYS